MSNRSWEMFLLFISMKFSHPHIINTLRLLDIRKIYDNFQLLIPSCIRHIWIHVKKLDDLLSNDEKVFILRIKYLFFKIITFLVSYSPILLQNIFSLLLSIAIVTSFLLTSPFFNFFHFQFPLPNSLFWIYHSFHLSSHSFSSLSFLIFFLSFFFVFTISFSVL